MADYTLETIPFSAKPRGKRRTPKKCKYCNKEGLFWKNFGTEKKPKWRLTEDVKTPHECEKYKEKDK